MALNRESREVAQAVRRHGINLAKFYGQTVKKAVVRQIDPLVVELTRNDIEIEDDHLVFGVGTRFYDETYGLAVGDTLLLMRLDDGDWLVLDVLSQQNASGGALPDYLLGDSPAALGLLAWTSTPNVPGFDSVAPGGGEIVRLMLLEQRPKGTITGAAIGLATHGATPHGTVKLGLASFADTPDPETATYLAVTDDVTADILSGSIGIRRFPFTDTYDADGSMPLWLAISCTDAWGTEFFVTGVNSEGVLPQPNAGYFRPRILSLAAGSGAIAVGGTHSAWSGSAGQIVWGGVY